MPDSPSRPATPGVLVSALVAIACLVAFSPVLRADFADSDDELLVTANPAVRGVNAWTLRRAFTTFDPELYIPLTLVSYQLNYAVGGLHPLPYHATNLALHALNAVLVALIVYLLSGRNRAVALLGGLLFGLHPIQAETAAWVSARKDLLSGFFFLLAYALFLLHEEHPDRRLLWASSGAFLCALLAKVVVVTLPVALLLTRWYRNGRLGRRDLLDVGPHFLLSVALGLVAILGKSHQIDATTTQEVVLMGARSLVLYAEKLLVPRGLTIAYPFEQPISLATPSIALSVAAVAAVGAACAAWVRRSRLPLFAFTWFVLVASPSFQNIRKGLNAQDVYVGSDRYAYLPSVAVALAAATALWVLIRRSRLAGRTLAATLIVVLAALSFRQAAVWRTTETLLTHALAVTPGSQGAHSNLATYYHRRGDSARAEEHYRAALALRPLAITMSNLADLYRQRGQFSAAEDLYQQAIRTRPGERNAYIGLGILYDQTGNAGRAEAAYRKAIELDPEYAAAYVNLGALYAHAGRYAEAVAQYRAALELNPFSAPAAFNMGSALAKTGAPGEAAVWLRRALEIDPALAPARKLLEGLVGG